MTRYDNYRAAGPNKYDHTPRKVYDRQVDRFNRKLKRLDERITRISKALATIHGFLQRSPHRKAYQDFLFAADACEEIAESTREAHSDPFFWEVDSH